MSLFKRLFSLTPLILCGSFALAEDNFETMPINEAMKIPEAKTELGYSAKFYFGEKPSLITGATTTNTTVTKKVARSQPDSCHRAFIQVLKSFKETAQAKHTNNIVNIVSLKNNKPVTSRETYQCSLSLLSAEVTLTGQIIWGGTEAIDNVDVSDSTPVVTSNTIADAFKLPQSNSQLGNTTKFYFGEKPENIIGSNTTTFTVSRKVVDSSPNACHLAFLEAMNDLKELALAKGINDIVNITSVLNDNTLDSKENYECSITSQTAEVSFKGDVLWNPATINEPLKKEVPTESSGTATDSDSVEKRLKTLKKLLDAGEIDQATYDAKKAKIIDSL